MARGAQPLVMADLARASTGRAVFIAPDDAAMRGIVEAAAFFAPELDVIEFPAWDSLPYDRASPALSISARRLAALHRLQTGKAKAQLIVTTANAVLQRVLTPFRIRESVREFKVGTEIGRESLAALLQRQGSMPGAANGGMMGPSAGAPRGMMGGGGGGSCNRFSSSQMPRLSGCESLPSEFITSNPAEVSRPPRRIPVDTITLRNGSPYTSGTP